MGDHYLVGQLNTRFNIEVTKQSLNDLKNRNILLIPANSTVVSVGSVINTAFVIKKSQKELSLQCYWKCVNFIKKLNGLLFDKRAERHVVVAYSGNAGKRIDVSSRLKRIYRFHEMFNPIK